MHILLIVAFWLVAGIIWGVVSGGMDHINLFVRFRILRFIIGAVAGFAIAWAMFQGQPVASDKLTIIWVLEVITVSQLVRNYVRNRLS